MLIRKTQQPSNYPENQIHDAYNTSVSDTYSCNYINDHKLKSSIIHEITPTNATNYADFGSTYYYKTGSKVHLHVSISLTTKTQTNIATLPLNFRPKTKVVITCSGGNLGTYGTIQVNTDGNIYCYSDGVHLFGQIDFDVFED